MSLYDQLSADILAIGDISAGDLEGNVKTELLLTIRNSWVTLSNYPFVKGFFHSQNISQFKFEFLLMRKKVYSIWCRVKISRH